MICYSELLRNKEEINPHTVMPRDRRKYYQKNKEQIKSHMKKYRLKNKVKINAQRKEYRLKNRKEINSYQREYQKKYPEKKLKRHITHINKLALSNNLYLEETSYALLMWSKTVKKLGNGTCQVCNMKSEISHHILHKAKYPTLSLNVNNGISLCKPCHNEVHGWNM